MAENVTRYLRELSGLWDFLSGARQLVACAMLLALLGACIVVQPATAPEELLERSADLPCEGSALQMDDGYALVPVAVNDYEEELLFLIDTGASRTLISPTTRYVLDLDRSEARESTLLGATGTATHLTYMLDSLSVGSFSQQGMEVTELDLQRFQRSNISYAGVLGNDFLKNANVEYNLPEERICFYNLDSEPTTARLDTLNRVPFYQQLGESGFITFELKVGGKPAKAMMDTGSSHTVFNSAAAEQDGARLGELRVYSETFGIGVGQATETRLYTFSEMKARDVSFTPQEVSIADLPIFQALEWQSRAALFIGNDLLLDRVVYINYSSRELYFTDPVTTEN